MAGEKVQMVIDIDASIKNDAEEQLQRMGVDGVTAIDMLYRYVINERRLPFKPKSELTLDEELEEAFWNCGSELVEVEFDDGGNIVINENSHPSLVHWAAND